MLEKLAVLYLQLTQFESQAHYEEFYFVRILTD